MRFYVDITAPDGTPEEVADALGNAVQGLIETVNAAEVTVTPEDADSPVRLVAVGNPFDGLTIYGPFADDDDRAHFTDNALSRDEYWWYPQVSAPSEAV